MNRRQQAFADEYITSGNVYQSAIKAGYSEAYARGNSAKLLENVSINQYIEKRLAEIQEDNIMSAKEALSILSDIARGKRDEEVLMMNPVTGEVDRVTKKADNATVIKAITEILKRYPTAKQAEKMQLEIDKLKQQITTDDNTESLVADLFDKLGREIDGNN